MMSLMSSSNDGRVVPPPERGSGAVEEEKSAASTSEIGSAGAFGFGTVASTDEAVRVGGDESDETRFIGIVSDSRVLKMEDEENRLHGSGGGEDKPTSSVCRLHGSSGKSSSRGGKLEHKKNMSAAADYDSILSAFDQFAARGKDEAVGYGFQIGDMVWGKVKSHPWWPGHIYNEALASPSVRRGKHEGHVLVAFFGDSSYGWFDPEELIPFEENFAEKSRQTTSRSFLKAVEEAGDEIARRSSLGLACRCRNDFNFSPSSVEGYFVVDVGDSEAGVYSLGQISKAQDSFRPRDMVSFLQEVALNPMSDQCSSVDFIKQKAAALAVRKMFFEEFDETYAQAFGTQPMRPSRPTAPAAVDPSKAPLRGRLVFAETLGKKNISVKPAKTKGLVEKDKYLSKRQEDSISMKSKKASSSQVGHFPRPLSVDRHYSGIRDPMHQASESCFTDGRHQPISQPASIDIKPSDSSRKLVEGGTKKVKFLKRPAGESIGDNAISVKKKKRKVINPETGESIGDNAISVKKKKKKVINPETGGERRELPRAVSHGAVGTENVSGMPAHVHPTDNSGSEDQKKDAGVGLSSSQSQQAADFAKIELQMLVTDLRAVALNPFHGERKSCPAVIKQVFLKYRSLVYQKSLVLVPPAESEASEGNSSRLPVPAPVPAVAEKIVRPSVRLDDPTKGGKKRDRPDDVQKKKLDATEGVKRKKLDDFSESKRKKMDNSKSLTVEKKIIVQPGDVKDSSAQSRGGVKQESSKRTAAAGQMTRAATPTMLMMKFPAGAALPSIPQLKVKFARFGPLDQSATRVFWKSYTCRLVYQHRIDAQAALKFADGSSNLFGNTNVRCYIREVEDPEPVKPPPKEDTEPPRAAAAAKTASEQSDSVQLKSCLKKPTGDEAGNGGGRSARVKFVLGGEDNNSSLPVPPNENKKNKVASFPEGASSSSPSSSIHSTSKILPKINPQPTNTLTPPFQQPEQGVRPPPPEQGVRPAAAATPADISQQMLSLLTRCSDVVNNLSAAYGCVPYYPL
ncbi:PWWP domain-containing protein 1-like [Salvia miltiorrhiza]|uniref:PWWP domain-containing protein 1-like n=1 Tax=Salvia miltiorrhiza TaxID=226208 RepID=UPI0025ABAFE0|nr:PWWP domain-containing protein 1-like [Salvia miltiorrhiza]